MGSEAPEASESSEPTELSEEAADAPERPERLEVLEDDLLEESLELLGVPATAERLRRRLLGMDVFTNTKILRIVKLWMRAWPRAAVQLAPGPPEEGQWPSSSGFEGNTCEPIKDDDSVVAKPGEGAIVRSSHLGSFLDQSCCCQQFKEVEGRPKLCQTIIDAYQGADFFSEPSFCGAPGRKGGFGARCSGDACFDERTCAQVSGDKHSKTYYFASAKECCLAWSVVGSGGPSDPRSEACKGLLQDFTPDLKQEEPSGGYVPYDPGEFPSPSAGDRRPPSPQPRPNSRQRPPSPQPTPSGPQRPPSPQRPPPHPGGVSHVAHGRP